MESRAQKIINLLARSESHNAQIESENAGFMYDIKQQDGCFIYKQAEDIQDHIPLDNINSEPAEILNQVNQSPVNPNQDSNVPQPIAEMYAPIPSSSSSSSSSSDSSNSSDSSSSSSSSRSSSPVQPIEDNRFQNSSPSILIAQSQTEPTSSLGRGSLVSYHISPMNSDESDADISDNDPSFRIERNQNRSRSSSTSSTTSIYPASHSDINIITKTKKRKVDPTKWKQKKQKLLRNMGQSYTMIHTNKIVPARSMKPPCSEKCRLKCRENIDDTQRLEHFKAFWQLGDLHLQRLFIAACITTVTPKYKYTNAEHPRAPNKAFHIKVKERQVKVCKTFFMNTFDISAKMVRTVSENNSNGYVPNDQRGKHRHPSTINEELLNDTKNFINSIPRIESHYLREATAKEYICSNKSIADLFRDFQEIQTEKNREYGTYRNFYDVFNYHFNLGFFQPKKDQCDLCFQYQNSFESQKLELKEKYDAHLEEKAMSREEKREDRKNIDEYNIVACYDVQAVMQSPNGETSSFYYKSKLNSVNFTITELQKLKSTDEDTTEDYKSYEDVHCYFWDESQGKRGAIEIGSCVYEYLKSVSLRAGVRDINVTFISDNCCGQNKNKYLASLYMYAVTTIPNIKTITHKYLIKGHTQNEADNVHSLIQRQIARDLKAGPIYSPTQYIDAIKRAKKSGKPFIIHTMTYDSFYDVKQLQEDWGYNFNVDEQKNSMTWTDIKVFKFNDETPFSFLYKSSYKDEFKEVQVRNKRKKMIEVGEITLLKAYSGPFALNANKKRDLKDLIDKNLIDHYHANYYRDMLDR